VASSLPRPSRRDELWKVWWLWGIPLAWLTTALVLGAEQLRLAGWPVGGDFLDVVRLAVYWFWCRLAWQCAGNVGNPLWTPLSRAALAAGLVATVLT
jgi:hypothetical protein